MRTFVYVDGFNLYYGALKGTPFKGLDLVALFEKVLQPRHDILKVKYFTARISGTPADPSKPQRQDVYLRALERYRPEVEVYFGHFLRHRVRPPLAQPAGHQRTVEVIGTEEKGSDRTTSWCPCRTTLWLPQLSGDGGRGRSSPPQVRVREAARAPSSGLPARGATPSDRAAPFPEAFATAQSGEALPLRRRAWSRSAALPWNSRRETH